MKMTRQDADLIRTVQAHLRSLASLSRHDADEATTRVASASLRALISEQMLQRAWTASNLRGPMTFKTYFIVRKGPNAVAYCGGGDILPGMPFSACFDADLESRTLNLTNFCRQPRIVVGDEFASTVDIIKYVANALGGAHYDLAGKAAQKYNLLKRIESGEAGQLFISHINKRNPLHHEIFSIAQAVVDSAQVQELLAWIPKF